MMRWEEDRGDGGKKAVAGDVEGTQNKTMQCQDKCSVIY
jgi:hypothetical protein